MCLLGYRINFLAMLTSLLFCTTFVLVVFVMVACAPVIRVKTVERPATEVGMGQAYLPNTELYGLLFPAGNESITLTGITFQPVGTTGGTLIIRTSIQTSHTIPLNIGLAVILGEIPVSGQPLSVSTEKSYFFKRDLSSSEQRVDISGNLILQGKRVWCYLFNMGPNVKGGISSLSIFSTRTGELPPTLRDYIMRVQANIEGERISNIADIRIP